MLPMLLCLPFYYEGQENAWRKLSSKGVCFFFQVYTLESRVAFAGWTQANIDNYKGPSPEVVSGLAQNVRQKLGSTYTVCEVGINTPRNKGGIGEFKARHANGSPFMIQSGTAGPTGGTTRNRTP
jgi:nicotinamide mononucleotide (NMN) deamidase PncC